MKKIKAKRLLSILLTLCVTGTIFISASPIALADANTGLGSFSAEPIQNAKYSEVIAHPGTKIYADANVYRISYDNSLPNLEYQLLFTVDPPLPSFATAYEFEWALYRVDPETDIAASQPNLSDTASMTLGKVALPTNSLYAGKYELRGHLTSHNGWLTFRIEITRTRPVSILKTDGEGNPLPGATIVITASDGTVYEAVSGSDGIASFNLPDDLFTVSESKAPEGYVKDESEHTLALSRGVWVDDQVVFTDPVLTFVNKEIPPEIPPEVPPEIPPEINKPSSENFTVKKVDENGAPLAGAIIRVEGLTDAGAPLVLDVTTNSAGEAVFTVENGTYVLSEYVAPTGYNATDLTYDISVTEDGVFTKTSSNTLVAYSQVVYVNKKIPELIKDDHNFPYMQGYPDNTFRPARNMSRAEAVVMFSRLQTEIMELDVDYRTNCYPDVDVTQPWRGTDTAPWYANQVCFMYTKGVLADYSRGGNFRPDEPVTRAEFATLAAHFDNLVLTDTNAFPDVPSSHWAVKYINSAAARGWIAGYPDGTFKPEAYITRAEVVTLVNRMLERKGDADYLNANANSLPRTYTDLPLSHWAYLDIMEASLGHNYKRVGADEQWTNAHR